MKRALQLVRRKLKSRIDQWSLIAIAIEAQLKVTKEDWISSHSRVNTQPSSRVSFDTFIKSLDARGLLLSGEKFFEKRTSLFDAMPAFWHKLEIEERQNILSIIKGVYNSAVDDEPICWQKEVVVKLAQYVSIKEVYKLRACYLVAQTDPSVIVGPTDNPLPTTVEEHGTLDSYFDLKPKELLAEYMVD